VETDFCDDGMVIWCGMVVVVVVTMEVVMQVVMEGNMI